MNPRAAWYRIKHLARLHRYFAIAPITYPELIGIAEIYGASFGTAKRFASIAMTTQ